MNRLTKIIALCHRVKAGLQCKAKPAWITQATVKRTVWKSTPSILQNIIHENDWRVVSVK